MGGGTRYPPERCPRSYTLGAREEEFASGVRVGSWEDLVGSSEEALISWCVQHGRYLPRCYTRGSHHVLVAEVMLQQIQVERGPLLPCVSGALLAGASLAEAVRVWGDPGRYERAANLRRTVCLATEEYGGKLLSDPGVLMTLPGVGPYTAGACFGFEMDAPLWTRPCGACCAVSFRTGGTCARGGGA